MRFVQGFILILFFCFGSFAQEPVKQTKIPVWKTTSVEKLARALTKDSCGEYEMAKRMYDWITENIKYDVWRYQHFRWNEITPKQTLRRRKAICSGYSILFQALCKEAGLNAWVVEGYGKIPNYKNNAPYFFEEHAWNVFQTDTTYHLVDVTWGSGGVVRKAILIRLFKHSFYFSRSKFVRKYNQDFFDSDTSCFSHTHVPLLPMWQLKTYALSVQRFEKQNFVPDSLSKNTIAFAENIQSYNSRTKEDNWLYEGNKGHDFFLQNNRAKGYHSYKYLLNSYKKYDLANTKSTDKTRKKAAASLADTVVLYTRAFIKNNKVRHKYVVDSIANRNQTILPFTSKFYKEDFSTFKSVKYQIRGLKNKIKVLNKNINQKYAGFARLAGDDIEKIKVSYTKANPDTLTKVITRLQVFYNRNTQKIDSLNTWRRFWYDSIRFKMPELGFVHDSITAIYAKEINYMKINTLLNMRLAPLYLIRDGQSKIIELRSRNKNMQNTYVSIQQYMITNYLVKQINPINRSCVILLKQNKSLLKKIAKLKVNNSIEKKSYRIENEKLFNQLSQTTKKSQMQIEILKKNIAWLKQYKRILRIELRYFKRDMNWQIAIDRFSNKYANGLNKFYYHHANYVIKSSLSMKSTLRYK